MGHCLRSHCEPGWSIGRAWSQRLSDLDLWLVLDGRGWISIDGQKIELHPGVAVLARPGVAYEAGQDLGARLCIDAIHFDLLGPGGTRLPDAALSPSVMAVPDMSVAQAVARRVRGRYHGRVSDSEWTHDPPAIALLRGLLLDLESETRVRSVLCEGGETAALHRHVVERAEERIRESIARSLSVAELAEEAGYTPDHFGRLFRELTGRSPQTAMVQARLSRARYLLLSTPMSITQIAQALGYGDVFFFSRQFKQNAGVSPTQFRRDAGPPHGSAGDPSETPEPSAG